MATRAINAAPTFLTYGPNLASEAELVTFYSFPSGNILMRTIPEQDYMADRGKGLMDDLSDAVESLLQEDFVTGAAGTQGIDDSGLVFDAVTFYIQFLPSVSIPGTITGDVQVPVNLLVQDTSFGGFVSGDTAAEVLLAEYRRLQALAGG